MSERRLGPSGDRPAVPSRETNSGRGDRVVESTREPAFSTDLGGVVRSWNRAVEKLTGIERDRAVGRPCWEVLAGKDPSGEPVCSPECSVLRQAKEGEPLRRLSVVLHDDHQIRTQVAISALRVPDDSGTDSVLHVLRPIHGAAAQVEDLHGERLGAYELIAPLGSGGMGVVYKAWDRRLERTVALKLLVRGLAASDSARKRFLREARAVASISHPNVCQIFDVGSFGGRPFLVMELLAGTTLAARLKSGPLPLREVVEIGVQLTRALEAAHSAGLIHRDVKPSNIFLTSQDLIKLTDFGLAKALSPMDSVGVDPAGATTVTELTSEGAIVGTARYLAPEQIQGLQVDARTDLYSLGVVLHEMTTGRPPFQGADLLGVVQRILHKRPALPSRLLDGTCPTLCRVLQRALEKGPETRYASAVEMRHDLRLALDEVTDLSADPDT